MSQRMPEKPHAPSGHKRNKAHAPLSVTERLAVLATLGIAFLIAWLTLRPASGQILDLAHADKIYHLVAFGVLIFPCAFFFTRGLVFLLPSSVILAGAIELIQPRVGRSGEWLDFLADLLGLGIGLLVARLLRKSFAAR